MRPPPPPTPAERPPHGHLLQDAIRIMSEYNHMAGDGTRRLTIEEALGQAFEASYKERATLMHQRLAQHIIDSRIALEAAATERFERAKRQLQESSYRRLQAIALGATPGTGGEEVAECCDCPAVQLKGTGFETAYGGWLCAACMTRSNAGRRHFNDLASALPSLQVCNFTHYMISVQVSQIRH